MIWINWWIWNKSHTIGVNFTFSYCPGWFPTVPHDGYISISSGQAACLLQFGASLFKTTLQCYFQREHRKQHPAHKSTVPWHANFIATECMVCHHSSQFLTSVSNATIMCGGSSWGVQESPLGMYASQHLNKWCGTSLQKINSYRLQLL
jgi:hypothetical protein